MTSRLTLYNGALRLLGERNLASLTENREPRRVLDEAWTNGAVNYCLEAGQWKFAVRSQQIDASPSVGPEFGFTYAFDKPTDHCRLVGFYTDLTMTQPDRDYREESGFWLSNNETIYVRYISNDVDYGNDLSMWPQRFVKFVEAHLACESAMPITKARSKLEDCMVIRKKALSDALSNDAMQEPTKMVQPGGWVLSRRCNRSGSRSETG